MEKREVLFSFWPSHNYDAILGVPFPEITLDLWGISDVEDPFPRVRLNDPNGGRKTEWTRSSRSIT